VQAQQLLQKESADHLSAHLVEDAKLVMADLDGCLLSEGRLFPETVDFVSACGDRLWIVSNNSTHTAVRLSGELAQLGLWVAPERILLAGEQTLRHLSQREPHAHVSLFASNCLHKRALELGLRIDGYEPDHVVLCRDIAFAIPQMEQVISFLHRGVQMWVANTDMSHPALDGRPVPETGALLAALKAVTGDFAFQSLGKPHAHMAQTVLGVTGTRGTDAVFVGDNPDTDGRMAEASGIPFIHICRGPAK
jgi:HAD superfamily hydrolase (TIGR01450 family)